MKLKFSVLAIACFAFVACEQPTTKEAAKSNKAQGENSFVDSVLASLSVEEKIGQMTQLTLDMLVVGPAYVAEEPHTIDPARMDTVFNQLHVGSILNCAGHSYSREKWLDFHRSIKQYTDSSRSKIPVLYGIDAIHGVTYTDESTLFPQQIALA